MVGIFDLRLVKDLLGHVLIQRDLLEDCLLYWVVRNQRKVGGLIVRYLAGRGLRGYQVSYVADRLVG